MRYNVQNIVMFFELFKDIWNLQILFNKNVVITYYNPLKFKYMLKLVKIRTIVIYQNI